MSSRFNSNLLQRDARSALFSTYDSRASSQSPVGGRHSTGGGSGGSGAPSFERQSSIPGGGAFGAYPTGGGGSGTSLGAAGEQQFRTATPNSRGQYSDAVLSELESQNDDQLQGMSAKVKMLKDLTVAIGDEIRDSSTLAEKMNDSFDNTRVRLRGTMNRMLRMAERTGVGWKAWLGFFGAVIFIFWYVWL